MSEWFEGFFSGLYGKVLAGQFDDRRSLEQARIVKRLLGVRRGKCVLDVPCGIGRLTLPMARMGLAMTGVDFTPAFLRRGRRQARLQGLGVRFIQSDMREVDFDGEFDGVFNWFGSFGYFSDADNLEFCRRAFRALKPGGRFLVEGPNKTYVLSHFRARHEDVIGKVRVEQRVRFDPGGSRICGIWTMVRGAEVERHRIRIKLFSGAEMRALLREAGFRRIALHTRTPAESFTRHSRRLIAVATKPGSA